MVLPWPARAMIGGLLCVARSIAWGQDATADQEATSDLPETTEPVPDQWIDRAHTGVHALVWKSAMYIDRLFGAALDEEAYRTEARGSITPALLWDEFHGLDEKFRFRVRLPFPYLDERYDAFVGTFNRDEVVTERQIASGAIPQQHVGGADRERRDLAGSPLPAEGGRSFRRRGGYSAGIAHRSFRQGGLSLPARHARADPSCD